MLHWRLYLRLPIFGREIYRFVAKKLRGTCSRVSPPLKTTVPVRSEGGAVTFVNFDRVVTAHRHSGTVARVSAPRVLAQNHKTRETTLAPRRNVDRAVRDLDPLSRQRYTRSECACSSDG